MSSSDSISEVITAEDTTVREIFSCIAQIEEKVDGFDRLLWPTPLSFYDFLKKDVPKENLENLWEFFRPNAVEIAMPALLLMDQVFDLQFPLQHSQLDNQEVLHSKSSWNTFVELTLGLDLFSMCYPLELVLTNLELLKDCRLKIIQMKRDQKLKQTSGLLESVKKLKTQKATEGGRGPFSPSTITQNQVMNTCKYKFYHFLFGLNGRVYIYSHIIHDCTFGGSQCKCAFMAEIPVIRRQSKFIRLTSSLGDDFWRAAAKYYFLGEKGRGSRCLIYLAGKGIYNMVNPSTTQLGGRQEEIGPGHTEGCMDCPNANLQALHWSARHRDVSSTAEINNGSDENGQPKKQCECGGDQDHKKTCIPTILKSLNSLEAQIFKFLTNNLVSPPDQCINTWEWLQSGIRVKDTDESYKHALSTYHRWVRLLTFEELHDFYKNKKKIYGAIDREFNDIYWDIDESLNKLEYYLLKQFHTEEAGLEFMITMYKSHTQQGGKKGNAIHWKGEQDSGKSWLADPFAQNQITYGGVSVLNRNNTFGLAGLVNKRLGMLDEFNFDPLAYTDNVKTLLSGNITQAQVKYKNDGMIRPTPILLMSNGDVLPDNEIFRSRHIRYEFSGIDVSDYVPLEGKEPNVVHPFYSKRLHPESIIQYWKKHGVWGTKYITNKYIYNE